MLGVALLAVVVYFCPKGAFSNSAKYDENHHDFPVTLLQPQYAYIFRKVWTNYSDLLWSQENLISFHVPMEPQSLGLPGSKVPGILQNLRRIFTWTYFKSLQETYKIASKTAYKVPCQDVFPRFLPKFFPVLARSYRTAIPFQTITTQNASFPTQYVCKISFLLVSIAKCCCLMA